MRLQVADPAIIDSESMRTAMQMPLKSDRAYCNDEGRCLPLCVAASTDSCDKVCKKGRLRGNGNIVNDKK